jgi:hypothetical protein
MRRRDQRQSFSSAERLVLLEDDLDDTERWRVSLDAKMDALSRRATQILQALVIGAVLMAANLAMDAIQKAG